MASRLKKAIGEKLREFRHKRYYTQEYLAELVELDIKQIGRIERGESYLKPENLEKFCKVLKVHPKDFYDFEWQFEEENLAAANGTYGRYIGIKSDFGVEKAIDINENFESELDLVEYAYADKTIKTQDIVDAISSGKLKFSMSNPTSTNSGASAYLGFLYTLAGNPEVLKKENLQDENVSKKLTTLFTGLERSSGSEEFLEQLFFNGNYDAVVTYESSIININKKLQQDGKETLYAIYPVDGVSISDSPFAYIDNKDEKAKEIFLDIQSYILSNEGQKLLQEKGRRTWYGGINSNVDKNVFNPDWGIDTTKYISPVKYPSTEVIKLALNLYQTELRKPVHVVFCLDYSGSMSGTGYSELINAMEYILSDEAANDFLQFSEKDKIDVIPFNRTVLKPYVAKNGADTEGMLEYIKSISPTATTALFPATAKALARLKDEDFNKYNVSIVAMTDGIANVGSFAQLKSAYKSIGKEIPIYSIMFGNAMESELQDMATLSNGKVFDGKKDLKKAFKEVRGYN